MSNSTNRFVYLVDDDPDVRDSLGVLFEAFGLETKAYASARAFLADKERSSTRGCIVLDLHMPEMTGLELLDVLREQGSELPVIVFTGRGDANLEEQVQRAGALALFAKPVDADALVKTIDALLDDQ